MRLICPNCEAQYEVADNAIPSGGRDVQCSNCGNTWYQLPGQAVAMATKPLELQPASKPVAEVQPAPVSEPAHAPAEIIPPQAAAPDESAPVARLKAAAGRKTKAATAMGQEPDLPPEAAETANVSDVASPAAVEIPPVANGFDSPPPLPRRKLEDSVASVLREEAAREQAARQADAAAVMGAAPVAPAAAPASDPVADRIAAVLVEDATLAQRATKGRELLPDIEEIKSTLRSGSDRGAESVDDDDADEGEVMLQRRRGFRSGFSLMFLIGVLLLLGYVSAPRIIQFAPASEPYVRAYVERVNSARFWLDGMMQQASNKLEKDSGQ